MESVADINLNGIGWVAVGGMSGKLQAKHRMELTWAAEVQDLCRVLKIPFLFKQSSNLYTERGINGLSLYRADRAKQESDPGAVPLIREYPATALPLLPFVEHGSRFTWAEYRHYEEACKSGQAADAGNRQIGMEIQAGPECSNTRA
jgi:hypothetical protein